MADCFENAARLLPEGYEIEVSVEKGSASAELIDDVGEVIADCEQRDRGETITAFVERLTQLAIDDAAKHG